ncbi:hypothetical protein GH741_13835 [Aquibacillus halophilus]|uniref:Uncharacterized protein n=1 Tax=Aquibacillus halophilus TaxID=930132 RepID=A0A6A8DDJ6_9BACI|nr:hypothetical protein [Aquibacillus halophilus]MRH43753.1 hypothetical protein [Aquibacillus halophilus]
MILYEWKNFGTDTDVYTKESFEEEINDVFEAMMIDDAKEIPQYIWTRNYVIIIKPTARMYKDVSFVKIPRNPSVV